MRYENDVYSDFAARHHLGDNISVDELEQLIESEARREEDYDRILAEQNLITPKTPKH